MLPEKPKKDKWINAKDFSWFFEHDNYPNISEEDWYFDYHMSLGMIMQTLADEAEYNGIEIIRCKDCVHCRKSFNLENEPYCYCYYWEGGTEENDFCSNAERRTNK